MFASSLHYKRLALTVVTISVIILAFNVKAHEKEKHGKNEQAESNHDETLRIINEAYKKFVKLIFQAKCLDCHGSGNPLPWYAKIPGPKHLIARDIREAKQHMDMSNDFPFGGHGTPRDDLTAIAQVLAQNSMPPFQYKLMHWKSGLTAKEKDVIYKWINYSKTLLQSTKENNHESTIH